MKLNDLKTNQFFKINKLNLKSISSLHLFIVVKIYVKMSFFSKQTDVINHNNLSVAYNSFKKAKSIGIRNFLFLSIGTNKFKILNPNKNDFIRIPYFIAYFLIKYSNKKLPIKYYSYFALFYLIAQELNISYSHYFSYSIQQIQKMIKIRTKTICEFFKIFFPFYTLTKKINMEDLYNAFINFQNLVINYNPNNHDQSNCHTKNHNKQEEYMKIYEFENYQIYEFDEYKKILDEIHNCLNLVYLPKNENITKLKLHIFSQIDKYLIDKTLDEYLMLLILYNVQDEIKSSNRVFDLEELINLIQKNINDFINFLNNQNKNELKKEPFDTSTEYIHNDFEQKEDKESSYFSEQKKDQYTEDNDKQNQLNLFTQNIDHISKNQIFDDFANFLNNFKDNTNNKDTKINLNQIKNENTNQKIENITQKIEKIQSNISDSDNNLLQFQIKEQLSAFLKSNNINDEKFINNIYYQILSKFYSYPDKYILNAIKLLLINNVSLDYGNYFENTEDKKIERLFFKISYILNIWEKVNHFRRTV